MRVIILLVVFYILLDSSTARIRNLKIKQAENTDLSRMQDSSNFKRITSKLQSLKINKSGSHDIRHIRSNSTRNPTMTAKENGKDRRHRNLELRKKTNRTLLRLTMQHMFGFNQASTRQRNETSFANENDVNQNLFHDQTVRTAPPDFIMERFRVYTKDSDFSLQESTTQGNTIRSFYPITGKSINKTENPSKLIAIIAMSKNRNSTTLTHEEYKRRKILVYAFNLSSIPATESLVRTELRLNGLRNFAEKENIRRNWIPKSWSAKAAVYESNKFLSNGTTKVYERLGHYVTVQSTANYFGTSGNIFRLAAKARRNNRLLVVRFNNQRKIFGRDDFDNFSEQILPEYFTIIRESSLVDSSKTAFFPLTPIAVIYCNDSTHSNPTLHEYISKNGMLKNLQSVSTPRGLTRTRRLAKIKLSKRLLAPAGDKVNNELPGEQFAAEIQSSTTGTTLNRNDRTDLQDNGMLDRQLIQSLNDRNTISKKRKKRKRRSRKCKKRKNKKSRKCNRKTMTEPRHETDLNRAKHVCSRKSLRVDFDEIGWSDWVISPKHFDAYYCSGMCNFNAIKKASPSNHAIIQSFINEFNINPEIPSPCCVPETLTSLSVLYFDQNDSVVLKVYPHMSVDKCACR